jgi:hypothetical protein
MLKSDSMIERNPTVLHSDLDDEVVMMDVDRGQYYGLNSSGRAIWQALATPATLADVVHRLTEAFDVEYGTCERDCRAVLTEMFAEGLVASSDVK